MPSSANRISASGRLVVSRAVNGWTKVSREDLPVLHQLLPDHLPHDLRADAEQLGDGGVGVVEAFQQNLRDLSLLLAYQPERIMKFAMQTKV